MLTDPLQTIKVTAIGLGLLVISNFVMSPQLAKTVPGAQMAVDDRLILSLLLMPVSLVVLVVAWHRYALLSNGAGDRPQKFRASTCVNYAIAVLKLFFISLVPALAVTMLLNLLSAILPKEGQTIVMWSLSTVAIPILLTWLTLRFGLILPAAALDQRLPMRASWVATAPLNMPLLSLSVILMLVSAAVQLGAPLLMTFPMMPPFLASSLVTYMWVLLSASVLSTLYGVLVQGRTL
jgi:hypothetical protein